MLDLYIATISSSQHYFLRYANYTHALGGRRSWTFLQEIQHTRQVIVSEKPQHNRQVIVSEKSI